MVKIKYNHDRTLEEFQSQLKIIENAGFKPIAVSQLYFEDTFVFETSKEANEAFNLLEKNKPSEVIGWWYGKDDFLQTVKEYETDNEGYSKVLIHWIIA
jgi:4-amino-4-deoxy-L-arabinose transferase-like glycosyltransferase